MAKESWFAIQVKRNHEHVTEDHLEHRGYETFLPLYKSRRRWSDRVKELDLPLFSGYLFCRMDPVSRLGALTSPGVIRIVGVGRQPVPVDEHEIDAIRAIVASRLDTEPHAYLQVGEEVRIAHGPLRGLSGILLEIHDQHRLVVGVSLLQRSVSVTIEKDWAMPLDSAPAWRYA